MAQALELAGFACIIVASALLAGVAVGVGVAGVALVLASRALDGRD